MASISTCTSEAEVSSCMRYPGSQEVFRFEGSLEISRISPAPDASSGTPRVMVAWTGIPVFALNSLSSFSRSDLAFMISAISSLILNNRVFISLRLERIKSNCSRTRPRSSPSEPASWVTSAEVRIPIALMNARSLETPAPSIFFLRISVSSDSILSLIRERPSSRSSGIFFHMTLRTCHPWGGTTLKKSFAAFSCSPVMTTSCTPDSRLTSMTYSTSASP